MTAPLEVTLAAHVRELRSDLDRWMDMYASLEDQAHRLLSERDELLAALNSVAAAYQRHFTEMPVAWQTYDDIVHAALAKVTAK